MLFRFALYAAISTSLAGGILFISKGLRTANHSWGQGPRSVLRRQIYVLIGSSSLLYSLFLVIQYILNLYNSVFTIVILSLTTLLGSLIIILGLLTLFFFIRERRSPKK